MTQDGVASGGDRDASLTHLCCSWPRCVGKESDSSSAGAALADCPVARRGHEPQRSGDAARCGAFPRQSRDSAAGLATCVLSAYALGLDLGQQQVAELFIGLPPEGSEPAPVPVLVIRVIRVFGSGG